MRPRWKPPVSAAGDVAPWASRCVVRVVAITEKIASPSAPPTHVEVLISAAASPALSAGTPAFAAVLTPTNTKPSPNDMTSSPGRMSQSQVGEEAGALVAAVGGEGAVSR